MADFFRMQAERLPRLANKWTNETYSFEQETNQLSLFSVLRVVSGVVKTQLSINSAVLT